MDPISAIGVVAASAQLAEVALKSVLKTIRLLKDLEGTPGKVKRLLSDVGNSVARILQIQQKLQSTTDNTFQHLSAGQLAALESSMNDSLQAATVLQGLLEPLVRAQSAPSGTRRMWNAIMSKKQWPEIEQLLQEIQRYDSVILRELQLSGLDMQSLFAEELNRTLATIELSHLQAEARFERLECLTEDIRQETVNATSSISQLELSSTTALSRLDDMTTNIGEMSTKLAALNLDSHETSSHFKSLQTTILSSQHDKAIGLRDTIEEESARTRHELVGLIMPVLLGHQTSLVEIQDHVARLSQESRESLGTELRRELMAHPSSLRDVCDFTTAQAGHLVSLRQLQCSCHCRSRKNVKSARLGFISIRYQSRVVHSPDCPEKYSKANYQSLGLAVQLLPFLNKTVELTFGATFHGGGFQIESPLRVFATVRRSESLMFQLFENFPERCKAEPTGSQWICHSWQTSRNGKNEQMFSYYTWDVASVKSELRQLRHTLFDIRDRRPGALSDRDELGHTLLHEIIILIGLLAPVYADVKEELNSLLTLAERSRIDIDAVAKNQDRLRRHSVVQVVGHNQWRLFNDYTAGSLARDFVRMFHVQFKEFSFLSRVAAFCPMELEDEPHEEPDTAGAGLPLNMRSTLYTTLREEPWLIKYFYDDDLPKILLYRQLDELRDILPRADLGKEYPWRIPLTALELAVGWPDGLKLLSAFWTHRITPAVGLAAHHYEWESLRALCDFPLPLFRDTAELRDFVANLLRNGTILVGALQDRRDQLAAFACHYFSITDQVIYKLSDMCTLDDQASAVYDVLKERDVPVPISLDPGPPGSIYNAIAAVYADPSLEFPSFNCVMVLDHLYSLGFRTIDERNSLSSEMEVLQYGSFLDESIDTPTYTPLEMILRRTRMKNAHWAAMSAWFLRRGARSSWEPSEGFPNILFGIAQALSRYNEEKFVQYHNEQPIRLLIEYAASLFSPLKTDGCNCFCTSGGCLAIHHILRNTTYSTQYRCHLHQGFRMWYWMRACGISGSDQEYCLEETVRFELFNRLDMPHTCCLGPKTMSEKERFRIQQESGEEKAQLDLLMKAYRASRDNRQRFPGDSVCLSACDCPEDEVTWNRLFYSTGDLFQHWSSWWLQTKQILPVDLTHVSWPDLMVFRNRFMDFQRRALRQRGYEGLDFQAVIEQHFEQELRLKESPKTPKAALTFTPRTRRELLDETLMHSCIDADFEPWDWLIESWRESTGDQLDGAHEDHGEEL